MRHCTPLVLSPLIGSHVGSRVGPVLVPVLIAFERFPLDQGNTVLICLGIFQLIPVQFQSVMKIN